MSIVIHVRRGGEFEDETRSEGRHEREVFSTPKQVFLDKILSL